MTVTSVLGAGHEVSSVPMVGSRGSFRVGRARLLGRSTILSVALPAVSRWAMLAAVATLAWQLRWRIYLPDGSDVMVPFRWMRPAFALPEILALVAVIAHALLGWPVRTVDGSGPRRAFGVILAVLTILSAVSAAWAPHPGLALVQAAHMALWTSVALLLAGGSVSSDDLARAFVIGLIVQALVGLTQAGLQHAVGLEVLGEPRITLAVPGWSVVYTAMGTLLRSYGLSPHPNILGGHAAVGLLVAGGLVIGASRGRSLFGLATFVLVAPLLLLTFSRSAWLALVAGVIVSGLLWRRGLGSRAGSGALLRPVGLGLAVVVAFTIVFQPFVLERMPRIDHLLLPPTPGDRMGLMRVAATLIASRPLRGVGAANFPIASRDVVPDGPPLDPVHNVAVLLATELGVLGLLAFLSGAGVLLVTARRCWRARTADVWPVVLGGSLAILATVMTFDHYVWTYPQGGLLWVFVTGWWLAEAGSRPRQRAPGNGTPADA